MTPAEVADAVITYLLESGWVRDSDDAGIWIPPGGSSGGGMGIGDAFALQLVADGVEWPRA